MGFLSSLKKIAAPVLGGAAGFALGGPAGAAIGAGLGGAMSSSSEMSDAYGDAKDINRDTLNAQERIYQQQRADSMPFYNVGKSAIPEYLRMLGIDEEGNRIESTTPRELSPLAQWQQQEFLKSQNRQDAARGLAGSGGASARIAEGNSAIAANDYQAQYQRILDALKLGTGASGAMGNAGAQYSSQIGQSGANKMELTIGQGDTKSQLWQGIGSLPMDYMSMNSLVGGNSPFQTGYTQSYNYQPGGSTSFNDKKLGLI